MSESQRQAGLSSGMLPRYGICSPCRVAHVRDGDTVEVAFPGSIRRYAIRLIGLACPELHERGGQESKAFTEAVVHEADQVSVFIPFTAKMAEDPLGVLSWDRIPGEIWIGTEDRLADVVIRAGHGVRDKRFS